MSYEALSLKVAEQGLYKRTYWTYGLNFLLVLFATIASMYTLTISDSVFLQVCNAVFLAIVSVQAGILGHDLSHLQVFESGKINKFCAMVVWGLFGGLSAGGWYDKHNAHHKYVNHEGLDPDLGIPFIFSEVQVSHKSAFVRRFVQPYQHVLFFIVLPFVYPNFVFWSFKRLFTSIRWENTFELLLIGIHFWILFYMSFHFLPSTLAFVFLMVVFLVGGTYMGIIFAPNHKGEEIVDEQEVATWLQQITLTRNLHPSWLGFYFFGGLDLQVEHHLFPHVSRFNYPQIHRIVKAYCLENSIRYYEVTWWQSMKEIYHSLKEHSGKRL